MSPALENNCKVLISPFVWAFCRSLLEFLMEILFRMYLNGAKLVLSLLAGAAELLLQL